MRLPSQRFIVSNKSTWIAVFGGICFAILIVYTPFTNGMAKKKLYFIKIFLGALLLTSINCSHFLNFHVSRPYLFTDSSHKRKPSFWLLYLETLCYT